MSGLRYVKVSSISSLLLDEKVSLHVSVRSRNDVAGQQYLIELYAGSVLYLAPSRFAFQSSPIEGASTRKLALGPDRTLIQGHGHKGDIPVLGFLYEALEASWKEGGGIYLQRSST